MKSKIILLQIILVSHVAFSQMFSEKSEFIENFGVISETFINGGSCYKTEVINDKLYVGCDAGLLIYDISDSQEYELLGVHNSNKVSAFYIKDNLLYLGGKKNGKGLIEIINIENPTSPELIFCLDFPYYVSGSPRNIFMKDNFIYISYSHLYMIDLNDWNNPVFYEDWSIYARDFEIRDNLLYNLESSTLKIYDIIDDTNFVIKSSIGGPGWNFRMCLKENLIYIPGYSLMIIDVSDPVNPEMLSEISFPIPYMANVDVEGGYAYVIGNDDYSGLLSVVNIQDLLNPFIVSQYYDFYGWYINVESNKVYLSSHINDGNGFSGLLTLDTEDPNNVYIQNNIPSSAAEKCRIYDNMAFVANGYKGFSILNISDYQNPVPISTTPTKWKAVDILKDGNILYIAEADSGIQIFDIENPYQPVLLSEHCTYENSDGYLKLGKYQNYLYTGGAVWINDILDVSDPENPVLVNSIPVNDWGYDIEIMDDHLFVAGYWGGLQIFSLADPENLIEVGYYPLDLALKIAVSKDIAYLSGGQGIGLFDISDLTNPQYITGYNPTPGQYSSLYHMYPKGDTLYYSNSVNSIYLLDVSDPYNPYVVDSIQGSRAISFEFYQDFIVSHDEYFLSIIGDTTTVSVEENTYVNQNFFLHHNYPNPCYNETNIAFRLNDNQHVKIELLDNVGRKLKTILNRKLNIGDHSFKVNTSSLNPGIYYYRVFLNGDFTESRKLLVVGN